MTADQPEKRNRRRRRRNRNRGQQNPEAHVQAPATHLPDLADEPTRPVPQEAQQRSRQPVQEEDQSAAARPKRPRGRSRGSQRQTIGPMSPHVLKRGLNVGEPVYPRYLRPMEDMIDAEASNFGCPMLSRSQVALPATGNQEPPRCALGWALHGEDEVRYCVHTSDVLNCWKLHPEHIASLEEQIQQTREPAVAD